MNSTINKFLFFIFLFSSLGSYSQQGLQMVFSERDSMEIRLQRQIEYLQFISGQPFLMGSDLYTIVPTDFSIVQPMLEKFNRNTGLDAIKNSSVNILDPGPFPFYPSPFFSNGSILSSAIYTFGDNFKMGGFSYGANSIFSNQLPGRQKSYFDTYGSTLFMQYKVSKNIKIETSVNVSRGKPHPGF